MKLKSILNLKFKFLVKEEKKMEELKNRMKNKLSQIKQQHRQDYESAVEVEITERNTDRQFSSRTTITNPSNTNGLSPSTDCIKEADTLQEGTWDEFSFGTNPDTTDRIREDSISSFHSREINMHKKPHFPVPKVPKITGLSSANTGNQGLYNSHANAPNQNSKHDSKMNIEFRKKENNQEQENYQHNKNDAVISDQEKKFIQTAEFKNIKNENTISMQNLLLQNIHIPELQNNQLMAKKEQLKQKYKEHKNKAQNNQNHQYSHSRQNSQEKNYPNENSRRINNTQYSNENLDLSLSASMSPITEKKPILMTKNSNGDYQHIDYLNTSVDKIGKQFQIITNSKGKDPRKIFGEVKINRDSSMTPEQHRKYSDDYEFNSGSTGNENMYSGSQQGYNVVKKKQEKENQRGNNIRHNSYNSNRSNTADKITHFDQDINLNYMSIQTAKTDQSRAKLRELTEKNKKRSLSRSSLAGLKSSDYNSSLINLGGSTIEESDTNNSQMRELMVMSKKLGKINQKRAESFAKLSDKYEKLLKYYTPYTEEEESQLGEHMVKEIGDIASQSIQKRNSKIKYKISLF